ncbi:MAG: PAS domain S-box protein [Actinomycetia bacterium]|nr:PAS domain S-box protein [Actinomycetes bacterium]
MGATGSTSPHPSSRLWERLIEPSTGVTDPVERRTTRLVSALLVLIAPLGVLSIVAQMIDAGTIEDQHVVVGFALVAILLGYLLSRTGHVEWAMSATLVPTVTGLAVVLVDSGDPGWFAFMALSPALGSLLLPARTATVLVVVNMLVVILATVVASDLAAATAYVAIVFNAVIAAVLLTARSHRDRLELVRRQEMLARQRLTDLILRSTFGGIAIHHRGEIIRSNETFGAMFGLADDSAVGRQLEELFAPKSQASLTGLVEGVEGGSADLVAMRRDGSAFEAEVLCPAGLIGTEDAQVLAIRDISDRKRAADTLVRAQRMESVGRLAAGIAHDTNNLLAVILINSERLATEQTRSGHAPGLADSIHGAAQQIATLLGRLQLVDRGRVDEPVVVDLLSFVVDRCPMWGQVVGDRIDVVIRHGDDIGQVAVDPTHLEQVLLNLVLNARDAMPAGGQVVVELDGVRLDEDGHLPAGRYQRIRVHDNGVGIPPENLEQVFEPFFTTKRKEMGTGIGLYTSREVIEESGGTLTVEVSPDFTTFQVLLPDAP